ncbi:MAG: hypothetical protein ACI4J9_06330, partial [Mogibacterium kristiansenii]|uniref:hypothetical protein n=1 Tax=Mogibacterium kristiansenii TaxID=2606708 RepID=UPI003F0C605A
MTWCKQAGKAIDCVGFAPRKCAAPPETGGAFGASKPGKAIDYVGFAPRKCAAPPETGGGL